MIFHATSIIGAYVVEVDRKEDSRGFFARTFSADEFVKAGLESAFVQCSISYNRKALTLRGMHYQVPPHDEVKIVRCTSGEVYDVIIDLRPGSGSYQRSFGVNLSAQDRSAIYIPAGVAHGFLTLTDDAELFYMINKCFAPEAARGVRWNDPAFAIIWPSAPMVVSDRDSSYVDFMP